nr:hypothetical protein [Paenibacillus monticola]
MLRHLRSAGFKKKFSYTCAALFRLVFMLLFHQKNWFRLLESKKGAMFPGKDAVYSFLNHSGFAWRRFLLLLSGDTISRMETLTSEHREKAIVLDDSLLSETKLLYKMS